jgi:hypothetical protein
MNGELEYIKEMVDTLIYGIKAQTREITTIIK